MKAIKPPSPLLWIVLGFAIVVISCAAIWIRWAQAEAPALSIAAYRLGIATLILTPIALTRRQQELRALSQTDLRYALVGGVCLALHFVFWISSLEFTSVASSVVLVTTNPIFVALGSRFLLHEPMPRALVLGILISVGGGVLVGYGDLLAGPNVLLGDGLALLGAMMASAYFLIGRRLRAHTDLLTYIFLVYGAAAIVLVTIALLGRQPLLGFSPPTYLWLLLLALGPQLIGHTSLNWALRFLPAGSVAVVVLGEPIGSALLAFFLLQEPLTPLKLFGGALILTGIYLALRAPGSAKTSG
ncbi:MAG: DMT family transporter [Candidatus Bipolaricaulota bacterium]|nr:DMT family transporter [Candidatus Bipolaricaulota bacterium]MCS7274544.1 DMT family transporter [Candidatus Bipolaricaulota bacterium]MDW8111211.1 DMT family transporter [Candidatus Bipolaricaulota bacterium]MDW8329458.1 DMT family transporter [Candidatus Bipolaricaulota bacterium]